MIMYCLVSIINNIPGLFLSSCPLAICSLAWSLFLLNTNYKPPIVQSHCKVHRTAIARSHSCLNAIELILPAARESQTNSLPVNVHAYSE